MSASPRAAQILLVGQKIRQIRKSRRLTQADLATRIGVTQSDLSRMENGEYKVGLDTLFKILQVFELSMSRFFEEPVPDSAQAEEVAEIDAADLSEQEQILRDIASLSEESRREVRDFIAFKRMQAQPPVRRPFFAPELGDGVDSAEETDSLQARTGASASAPVPLIGPRPLRGIGGGDVG